MADKEEKPSLITIQALPSCIDEPAKSIALPVTSELGQFLSDLLYHVTGKVHLSADKKRAQNAHELKIFKEELTAEIRDKPVEYLTEPKRQVVGQAFDQVGNCMDEESIRKMFEKLIANAADTRYQALVHPSFPAMISQLSPLDAENLALFNPGKRFPIVTYQLRMRGGGEITYFENCFLENPVMNDLENLSLQATSIESLNRQGIVKISYTTWLFVDKLYDKFNATPLMISAQQLVGEHYPPHGIRENTIVESVYIQKGLVELTPLGKAFVKVCFNT